MDRVRETWGTVMAWAPPPVRLAVFFALALLALLRGLPVVMHLCGAGLRRSGGMLALLTFPEYLLTTLARRVHRPPLPGTFAYGQLLGAIHQGLLGAGTILLRAGRHRVTLRRSMFLLPATLVVTVWYTAAGLPPGEFGDAVRVARTGLATTDAWLMAGDTSPPAVCPAAPRTSPSATEQTRESIPSPTATRKR